MVFLVTSNTQHEFGSAEGTRPQKYRTIQPPMNDSNFRSICANSSTFCVFAHVRKATTGVVHLFNNHPFQFDRHMLQHNGGISHFEQIKMKMCGLMSPQAFNHIRGSTDSEHIS
jgi:glutamine amidotransferase